MATLYEYWVFFELARIVADMCQTKPDLSTLIDATPEAISLVLRRGEARSVGGTVSRRGRVYRLDLHFNREFRANASGGSWTRTMRPDCSLCITPVDGVAPKADELWLHFDAKYRVLEMQDLGGDIVLTAKDEDLLKMHAYRDAIVRAAGAYVIFPGTKASPPMKQHAEAIPSLGAFPLRPGAAETGDGAGEIRKFLHQVLDQLAEQSSPYERARYWQRAAYSRASTIATHDPVPFLAAPAADTKVLVGYLRSPEHAAWVQSRNLYNVRAEHRRPGSVHIGGAELAAEFLLAYSAGGPCLLYHIVGSPILMTKKDLLELAYPMPRGDIYVVFSLASIVAPTWITSLDVSRLSSAAALQRLNDGEPERAPYSPFAVSWLDIAQSAERGR